MVRLLPGRGASAPSTTPREESADAGPGSLPATGKGRPTPRRRDAQSARRTRARVPTTRKEAQVARRSRMREEQAQRRAGLLTGDERYLSERDRGPVKRFVRDTIDARRNVAEYFLPAFLLITFLGLPFASVPGLRFVPNLLVVVVLVVVALDTLVTTRRLRRGITDRFGADKVKGNVLYGVLRSTQFRRLRAPRPQVRPGAGVR